VVVVVTVVLVYISGGPTSVVAVAIVVMREKRRFGLLGLKEKAVRMNVDFDRIYRTICVAWAPSTCKSVVIKNIERVCLVAERKQEECEN